MKSFQSSELVQRLTESVTLSFAKKARELKDAGKEVISLALGEPDFDTPDFIKEAVKQAVDENHSHYTPISGTNVLRDAICNKFLRDNNIAYKRENIVVSTGAKQCIFNVMLSVLNPEDELLIIAPYWVSYKQIADLTQCGINEVCGKIENNFKISPQELETSLTNKTRLVIFSSPSNPSGAIYSQSELEDFAKIFERFPDAYVIADEIYEHIHYKDKPFSIGSIPSMKDRVITINGLSKGFAMTGYRLGYMAAPVDVANACSKLQGQVTSGANAVTQQAAITALNTDPKEIQPFVDSFKQRRDLMLSLLNEIPDIQCNVPQGAFYVFANIEAYSNRRFNGVRFKNSLALCTAFLEHFLVALVPGEAFGAPWHIRLSYASSEADIREACKRIKEAFTAMED
jgi:aspartate aminotransferase